MINTYFFGYGSLVNRATHDYQGAHHATLHGWRRVWCHIAPFPRAILSVKPDPNSTIKGLIAGGPDIDWAVLDQREHAYDKAPATEAVTHGISPAPDIIVYTIPDTKHPIAPRQNPILLSYIDVVAQGYLDTYGEAEAEAFFAETAGWGGPILDDRAAPIYPRHQQLSAFDRGFVDTQLAALSAVIKQP